ncbi:MAG: serine/threonine protein kinase [Cyanobacteria bacterium J06638_7]
MPEGFLKLVETELLPGLLIRSLHPHDPVVVERLPAPWRALGSGNYAAVLLHPQHSGLVVKVYAPGRPGLPQEAEVYRRIGIHPAFSVCHHVGGSYLVLKRLHGTTLYNCVRQGVPIPLQVIRDIDAAIAYAQSRGLHGHDVHGRNVLLHRDRGRIVDISDFLNPEPCFAWRDLRRAYHLIYRPLIAPLRLRVPTPLLERLRRGYRLYRRLRSRP